MRAMEFIKDVKGMISEKAIEPNKLAVEVRAHHFLNPFFDEDFDIEK